MAILTPLLLNVLFPVTKTVEGLLDGDKYINYATMDRFPFIYKWLIDSNWLTVSKMSHPDVMKMVELWKQYVKCNPTDIVLYEEFKKAFINVFGEKGFYDILQNTYFIHENAWLIKNKINTYHVY